MPNTPTSYDIHQSTPLQNFSLAAMDQQKEMFAAPLGGYIPVKKRKDTYYTYAVGSCHRLEMQPRGPGGKSAGSGWTVSTDSYQCLERSVHKDNDWDDIADSDEVIDLEEDASDWLGNQLLLEHERDMGATVFVAATWTTDYDGVTGSPGASEILRWSETGSTPQSDVITLKTAVRRACLRMPNTMIVGEDVHNTLTTHAEIRDAAKYTNMTVEKFMADWALLANYFGVKNYAVAGGMYNASKEGQTTSMTPIIDADDVWIGYLDPNPKKKTMTAWTTFVWEPDGGMYSRGVAARTMNVEEEKVLRHEVDFYKDVKVIAADAGAFIDEAV